MKAAMDEIGRRRKIQEKYNREHGLAPEAIVKGIRDWPFASVVEKSATAAEFGIINDAKLLDKEMKKAAKDLDFERAAELRDLIKKIKNGKDKSYADT